MSKIAVLFGTRPEWIKCRRLIEHDASMFFPIYVKQHSDLLKDVPVEYTIPIIEHGTNRLNNIMSSILHSDVWTTHRFAAVLVQGDTVVAYGGALAAYHNKIPIVHLEAGLRTYDLEHPYPEEGYRKMIDAITSVALCPSDDSANNIRREGGKQQVYIVGNTSIDNIVDYNFEARVGKKILVTLHRRENWDSILEYFQVIERLANKYADYEFILPIHPNPIIRQHASAVFEKVQVVEPMEHTELCKLLAECNCVISDSGGIQEEASFYGKRIFCCRKVTERAELVPTYITFTPTPSELYTGFSPQSDLLPKCNLYGDGTAYLKCYKIISDIYGKSKTPAANITAIVNIYKRPEWLDEQITAIMNQTIPPTQIFIWNNGNKHVDLSKYKEGPNIKVFDNNSNYGVWSRFLIATLAPTEYVCIFDDDTIPQPRWFENCYTQMQRREALYGTIGVIFDSHDRYEVMKRYGWDGACETSKPVDIVGHSWFFKRDWISYFMREQPKVYSHISNGEDVHFSHMLQKYANIPTLVPPHPASDVSVYGSTPTSAWSIGLDGNSETGAHYPLDQMFKEAIDNGFRVLKSRINATSVDDYNMFTGMIRRRKPFALIRPADGEYHVLNNMTLTNIDAWTFISNGALCNDLREAINLAVNKQCYIGIPCECCNIDMSRWYMYAFNLHPMYTTFSNVLVNNNWISWIRLLQEEKIQFTYVGPHASNVFNIEKHIQVPETLVNDWDALREECMKRIMDEVTQTENKIYFFSCGPIAKIFIAHAWAANPKNIYIDVGSSLDVFTKGATNRCYVDQSHPLSKLICKFSPNVIQL